MNQLYMILIDVFYFGFENSLDDSPIWFDWLTLILTIGAIVCSYLIADCTFKREVRANTEREKNESNLENRVFLRLLKGFNKVLKKQIVLVDNFISADINTGLTLILSLDSRIFDRISMKAIYSRYANSTIDETKIVNVFVAINSLGGIRDRLAELKKTYKKEKSSAYFNFRQNMFQVYKIYGALVNNPVYNTNQFVIDLDKIFKSYNVNEFSNQYENSHLAVPIFRLCQQHINSEPWVMGIYKASKSASEDHVHWETSYAVIKSELSSLKSIMENYTKSFDEFLEEE